MYNVFMSKSYGDEAIERYKKMKGVLSIQTKDKLDSQDQLSIYYTPGVAAVSSLIASDDSLASDYTWTDNLVAIISDGSAVLGLGNIGPKAAMPVMEGKAMIFKQFAGIDAVPIVLDVHSADQIVDAI